MLFNSYTFVFGFLPVVLGGFYILGARRREWVGATLPVKRNLIRGLELLYVQLFGTTSTAGAQ